DRRYVGVYLDRSVLAARSGNHVGDGGRGCGFVGHQGQIIERAAVSAARWRVARDGPRLRACERGRNRRDGSSRRAVSKGWIQGHTSSVGDSGPAEYLWCWPRIVLLRAGGEECATSEPVVVGSVHEFHSDLVRTLAEGVRTRAALAARRPSPFDAYRSGKSREVAGALPPVLDGRPNPRGVAGELSIDSSAHGYTAGGRRGVQLHFRFPDAD